MTREEFIEKAKELAIEFWTMNLRDGTYESRFMELLDEYEGIATVKYNYTLDIGGLDLREIHGWPSLAAGAYTTVIGWKEQHSDAMCFHECPNCNCRCNCSIQPCSCCNEA